MENTRYCSHLVLNRKTGRELAISKLASRFPQHPSLDRVTCPPFPVQSHVMPHLFSYGTLQQEKVQLASFGRLLKGVADILPGWRREMVEIINKVEPRFGSGLMAYAWYRSEPLPGFSGQTAMRLVLDGRANEVLAYIDAVDAGVHA